MPDRPSLNDVLDRAETEAAESADGAIEAAESAEAETESPESAVTAAPETPPADSWLADIDPKAAAEIKRLRKESQNYRQRAKGYDDVFEGYSDDDRQFLLDIARELKDPSTTPAAAAKMRQVAEAVMSQNAPPGDERPLTASDIQRILDERDQRSAAADATRTQQAAVEGIFAEAEALGYQQRTPEMILLLHHAKENELSVAEAHKELADLKAAEEQAAIDRYLAKRAKDSDDTPDTRTPGGSAPSGEKKITNLKEAKAALLASNLLKQ